MAHKNDYSCIVYFPNNSFKKWNYVHTLTSFEKFLNEKHAGWKYINVYERRSGKFLKRFYKGNIMPPFLPSLVLAALINLSLTFNNTFKPSLKTFNNDFNNTATIQTNQTVQKGGFSI